MGKSAAKKESLKDKSQRTLRIYDILTKTYPDATCALDFKSAYELLIATILAAQCTDVKVNQITPMLFKKYPTVKAFAEADLRELEKDIKPTGFFHNKSKSIKNCSIKLLQDFNGKVPETMEQLTSLPGVGRKTANVILGNFFHKPAIIVDTHVLRLSQRLGLSNNTNADKVEFDLIKLLPEDKWTHFSNCLVFHGRQCCNARKPACERCPIIKYCPYPEKI